MKLSRQKLFIMKGVLRYCILVEHFDGHYAKIGHSSLGMGHLAYFG